MAVKNQPEKIVYKQMNIKKSCGHTVGLEWLTLWVYDGKGEAVGVLGADMHLAAWVK